MSDPDFLALVYVLGGSCFGRSKDKEQALRRVVLETKDFVRALGQKPKKGAVLKINLYDLSDSGIQQVTWDDFGVKADGKPMTIKPELVERPIK